MTDLEKLESVFDGIGIQYECQSYIDNKDDIQIESSDGVAIFIRFKDGKFTHID